MRRMRITKLSVALMCGALGLAGHYAGLRLPWEALVQSALLTAQLPATRIAAFVVIVVTSALLMWGPGTSAVRRLAQFAYWIAVVCAQRLIRDVFSRERDLHRPEIQTHRYEEMTAMNSDYEILTKYRPNWKPHCVRDDGEKAYIHFPEKCLRFRMPVLYVPDEAGKRVPTEYELQGNIGVVNRVFSSAELKTFGPRGCVVRIRLRDSGRVAVVELPDLAA